MIKCRDSLARKQFCRIMHTFRITLEAVSVQKGKKPVKFKKLLENQIKNLDNPKKRKKFCLKKKWRQIWSPHSYPPSPPPTGAESVTLRHRRSSASTKWRCYIGCVYFYIFLLMLVLRISRFQVCYFRETLRAEK